MIKLEGTGKSKHIKKGLIFEATEEESKHLIKNGSAVKQGEKKAPAKAKKEEKKEEKKAEKKDK